MVSSDTSKHNSVKSLICVSLNTLKIHYSLYNLMIIIEALIYVIFVQKKKNISALVRSCTTIFSADSQV